MIGWKPKNPTNNDLLLSKEGKDEDE